MTIIWPVLTVFSKIRGYQKFHADDLIDKLNRSFTVSMLIIPTIIIGMFNIFGEQIVCNDDSFRITSSSVKYIESACWVKEKLHRKDLYNSESKLTTIGYYHWLIFILLGLSLLYYLPYLLWKNLLNSSFGKFYQMPIDVSGIINSFKETKIYKLKELDSSIKEVVDYLNSCFIYNSLEYKHAIKNGLIIENDLDSNGSLNFIKLNDKYQRFSRKNNKNMCLQRLASPLQGSQILLKYLFVKLLYILISFGVFFLLNLIFKFGYTFGIDYTLDLISGKQNETTNWNSLYFPRIVFCQLGLKSDALNFYNTKFQCTLPANVYYEKMILILWFWFLLVAILNCFSLINWLYIILIRQKYIKKYLNLNNHQINGQNNSFVRFEKNDSRLINLFINNYLQYDGFLVLLIIKSNVNDIFFKRLIDNLWKIYSITNLDDHELLSSPPITSTVNIDKIKIINDNTTLTSPNVVPQQPSMCILSNGNKTRKLFNNANANNNNNSENVSESKIKLLNDDSDYFNNETQNQTRLNPTTKGGTYIGFRKEDLV